MVGSPIPRSDGSHSISAWRKFAKVAREKAKPTEKEGLELKCLRLKAARLEHEIGNREKAIREEVRSELLPIFDLGPMLLKSALYQMRNELCPRFEGMNARAIWRMWDERERQAFNHVYRRLMKKFGIPLTEPAENIVPVAFDDRKAASR